MTVTELSKICLGAMQSGLGEFDIDSLLVGGKAVLTLKEAQLASNLLEAVKFVMESGGTNTVDFVYAKYINNIISKGLITGDSLRRNTVLTQAGCIKAVSVEEAGKSVDYYVSSKDTDKLFNYITQSYLFKEFNELTALLVCIRQMMVEGSEVVTDFGTVRNAMKAVRSGETVSITSVLSCDSTDTDSIEFNGARYRVSDIVKSLPMSVRKRYSNDYTCAMDNVASFATLNLGGVL